MPEGYAADIAVPVWTELMKAATAGHKPEWLPRPEGLVAQVVCRMSGKLAVEGCSAVEAVNDLGEVSVRSMAYTEFFRRGEAPADSCPLHAADAPPTDAEAPGGEQKPGFWSRLFGRGDGEKKPQEPPKPQ